MPIRTFRQQGAPAWHGRAPAMRHNFYLPSTPRPHVAANDNQHEDERDAA